MVGGLAADLLKILVMTVAELIDKLRAYPQDLLVIVGQGEGEYDDAMVKEIQCVSQGSFSYRDVHYCGPSARERAELFIVIEA